MNNTEFIVNVHIEIAKNSTIKYEFDKSLNALVCDRILHTPLIYIFNYGYIPNTLSEDNDPLDAIVLIDEELLPGSYIKCKIIGCLETEDDAGIDPKLLLCPISKIDPMYDNINDINDIPEHTLNKIKYFFQHYKDLENKNVKIGNFLSKEESIKIYNKCLLPDNDIYYTNIKKTTNE
jgi:inorganic pyrophosphatase